MFMAIQIFEVFEQMCLTIQIATQWKATECAIEGGKCSTNPIGIYKFVNIWSKWYSICMHGTYTSRIQIISVNRNGCNQGSKRKAGSRK